MSRISQIINLKSELRSVERDYPSNDPIARALKVEIKRLQEEEKSTWIVSA